MSVSLSPRKGLLPLIEALGQVRGQNWRLDVVGSLQMDHRYANRCRKLSAQLGVARRIRYRGQIADSALKDIMAAAHLLCMPFAFEGFGITTAEAMRCGVPVMGSTAGATRELITHGVNGLLLDPGDHSGGRGGRCHNWLPIESGCTPWGGPHLKRRSRTRPGGRPWGWSKCLLGEWRNPDPLVILIQEQRTWRRVVAMPLHTDSHRYIRYLAAKREIDDRALSQSVWRKLRRRLRQADRRGPLAVIEMGGGIGTMFDRVLDWALTPHLRYTLIEANRDYLAEFQSRLKPLPFISTDSENRYHGQAPSGVTFALEMSCDDIYAAIDDPNMFFRYDLVMAHAVMDLVNIPETLNGFQRLLRPGGPALSDAQLRRCDLFSTPMGARIRRDARVPLSP